MKHRFETRVIHVGCKPETETGAIMTPIFQTSTFVQESPGKKKGFGYSRTRNPTRVALEENIASLEDGNYGLAFSSGMAAITTIAQMLSSGDHVVCCDEVYSGTYSIFEKVFKRYNLEFDFIDLTRPQLLKSHIKDNTKIVWMERHERNAMKIAQFLEEHPKVRNVIYPGLESHPQHGLAKEQMSGFGGIISFFMNGGIEAAMDLLESVKIFSLAVSLGGVESLIEHPATMSHSTLPKEVREKTGISDELIRVSIGIENVVDLIEDLDKAL